MKTIDRSILDFDDSAIQAVNVPEWGGVVYVRRITAGERLKFVNLINSAGIGDDSVMPAGAMELLVIMACVDKDGKQIFEPEDKERLSQKSATAVNRIFEAAAKLNGLTAQSIEDTTGELKPTPN